MQRSHQKFGRKPVIRSVRPAEQINSGDWQQVEVVLQQPIEK